MTKTEDKNPTQKFGGFDKETKTLQPMRVYAHGSPYSGNPIAVLENITGAVEAGVLTDNGWVSELFASPECFAAFKSQLIMADEAWTKDNRWSQALHKLAGCKQKQRGLAMLLYKLSERGRATGQVVDYVVKVRGE